MFRHGLKSEPEEISQKFNFLLKGMVSEHFLKTFGALVMCSVINGSKIKKNNLWWPISGIRPTIVLPWI